MSLDLSKLENVNQRGGRIIARCPACAKDGNDEKGEHLVIMPDGRFGCVVHPGAEGRKHRKLISAVAGDPNTRKRGAFNVRVRRPTSTRSVQSAAEIVDVAHLGRETEAPRFHDEPSQLCGLPSPPESMDGVGRIGRVSFTHAPRVNQSIREEREENVHTHGVGRNPSNASTPVQTVDDGKPASLFNVLEPDSALVFVRLLVGDKLPAMSDRLGMIQAATDGILLAWNHEHSELARKLAAVDHRTLALAAAHAGMVLVGALHAGQDARDAGETATEALCELLGFDPNFIHRVADIPSSGKPAPGPSNGRKIDPETGYSIIDGAICPF